MSSRQPLRIILFALAIVVLLVSGAVLGRLVLPDDEAVSAQEVAEMPSVAGADQTTANIPSQNAVVLSSEKLSSAAIQTETVTFGTLTHTHSVPGRVVYDDNRHIEVKAPASGILTQVLVKPGDAVEARQVLAWLNSSEVGSARADVLQQQAMAQLTQSLAERASIMEGNVTMLTSGLRQLPDFDTLRNQLEGRVLGDYREKLFSVYSRLQLADSLAKDSTSLAKSGALSGKVAQEYQAELRSARAALEAACEQADLEVWRDRQQAEATARDAQRRLEIARQQLASLLLNEAATSPDQDMPEMAELGASDSELKHLSRVALRAPFAGTIESRTYAASERVQASDTMFVLADTTSLWISAEIRENDWPAVAVQPGQSLTVVTPALGNAEFQATVEFIGREVSPDTNAVPIVARIDNSAGRLRPGLFIRVAVPVAEKTGVLTVPTRSVMRHDGRSFVFIAETANRFRRVDIVTGDEGERQIEVVSGVNVNERVVTQGAFILKSELLLESEAE